MRKLIKSFGFAFNGIIYAVKSQQNFRIHLTFTFLALLLGWFLNIAVFEWLWVMLCITIVLFTELLNTALETLTDLVSPGYHEIAGRVKDISAAAVLVTALFALITGIIIFLPKIVLLFSHAA